MFCFVFEQKVKLVFRARYIFTLILDWYDHPRAPRPHTQFFALFADRLAPALQRTQRPHLLRDHFGGTLLNALV